MAKQGLESYVTKRYGRELREVIQQKVESEGLCLCDHEIADILNANTWVIRGYRKAFAIKKANAFSRRFERTYGESALDTFRKIVANPENSLADAGRHF